MSVEFKHHDEATTIRLNLWICHGSTPHWGQEMKNVVRLGEDLSRIFETRTMNDLDTGGERVGIKPTKELWAWELPNRANP
jgi:hypothetical protein